MDQSPPPPPPPWPHRNHGAAKRPHQETTEPAHPATGEHSGSPWQQAFKRLRVTHEEDSSDVDDPMSMTPPPVHHRPIYYQSPPPPRERQTAGQDSMSEEWRTPTIAKPQAQYPSIPDTDYKSVNNVLGELHRQRRLREQHEAAAQLSRRLLVSDGEHERRHSHHGGGHRASSPKRSSPSPMMTTPPARRRKVVHLHTDSKLG